MCKEVTAAGVDAFRRTSMIGVDGTIPQSFGLVALASAAVNDRGYSNAIRSAGQL
jgi:hypothetical protein